MVINDHKYIYKILIKKRVYTCDSLTCRPRERSTAESVVNRDLSRFTLNGITMKEAPITILE